MSESSVRSWIRRLRFQPECYDQSVFYIEQGNNDPSEITISHFSSSQNYQSYPIPDDDDSSVQNISEEDYQKLYFETKKCEQLKTLQSRSATDQRIENCTDKILDKISRNMSDIGLSYAEKYSSYNTKKAQNKERKNSLRTRSFPTGSSNYVFLETLVEQEPPEGLKSASFDELNKKKNDFRTFPEKVCYDFENFDFNLRNNIDDSPVRLNKYLSNSDDDDNPGGAVFDDSSNDSFLSVQNSWETTNVDDDVSSVKKIIYNNDLFEEVNTEKSYTDNGDNLEPIYMNVTKIQNNIKYGSADQNSDNNSLEMIRRKPKNIFKRNSRSVKRRRFAILDKNSLTKFDVRNRSPMDIDVYQNNPSKSDVDSDTVSWKSTCSSLLHDSFSSSTKGMSHPEVEDDSSSDSLSWKSSSSFALTSKCEYLGSIGPNENVKTLPTDDYSLGCVRRKEILEDFRRHAILEPFNDQIFMSHRQILHPTHFVQECFLAPTFQLDYSDNIREEIGSLSKQCEKTTGETASSMMDCELNLNESEKSDKSETMIFFNNSDAYENIWDCTSGTNSNDSYIGQVAIKRWSVKFAVVNQQPAEFETTSEFESPLVFLAQVSFGDVLQWQKELAHQFCSEIGEYQEYTSLEGVNDKKENISPFPLENDVEVRKKTDLGNFSHRSQTIHFGHGYVTEAADDVKKERCLNMNSVSKIYFDGTSRKISKNQMLRIFRGNMMLVNDKGETEILNSDVHITRYKPTSRKEIQITNTTSEECKLYKLQFDNSKDANAVLGELHKYFNRNLQERPRSNSLTDNTIQVVPPSDERIQIRHRLLKLLGRRSSKDILEKKGIIRNEPIFGNTLNNLHKKYQLPVPQFVVKAIGIIELPKNITSLGLYRASGNLATIQKIRFQVDRNNLKILDDYKCDIDVVTGALKLFFRELKEPVIPHKTYEELLRFLDKDLEPNMVDKVKYLIGRMEMPHRETFLTLLRHLVRVEKYKQTNKMDAFNISVVWGPTLIWPPETTQENILQNHTNANKIIEMLLNVYRKDFLVDSENNLPSSSNIKHRIEILNEDLAESSRKQIRKDSFENISNKTSVISKIGSMENLLKAMKRDSVVSPKDSKWSLDNICKSSKEMVPEFLLRTIPLIEKHLKSKDIYTKQLSQDRIEKIKTKITRNKYSSLEKSDFYELTSSVKLFFSELDPPLIPTDIFLKMIQAIGRENEMEKSKLIKKELGRLSPHNKATLSYLFKHLVKVCRQSEFNSMSLQNMALSWMPVLCKNLIEHTDVRLDKCVEVIEYLIELHDENSIVAVDLVENLKLNLIAYSENYQKYGKASVKSLGSQNNFNNNNSTENILEHENSTTTNNNDNFSGVVKKRPLKNSSALYRVSKYYVGQHPPSIYDNVPSTQIVKNKEEIKGEAKLLETDDNKNFKKHERTTKL